MYWDLSLRSLKHSLKHESKSETSSKQATFLQILSPNFPFRIYLLSFPINANSFIHLFILFLVKCVPRSALGQAWARPMWAPGETEENSMWSLPTMNQQSTQQQFCL